MTDAERELELCELKARLLELEKQNAGLLASNPARPSGAFPLRRGWIPRPWSPALAGIALGIGGSVGVLILSPGELTLRLLVGTMLVGASSGLGGYLGTKSMGPRPPPPS